jgi:alkylation response protein AidB-like acyl-CoA dehydrogenase
VSIGLTAEHEALRDVAARWLAERCPPAAVRAELDASSEPVTPGGREFAELAEGFGLLELAVVVEQSGRAMLPGGFLPSAFLSVLLGRAESGTVAWRAGELVGDPDGKGAVVRGELGPVMSAASADWLLAPVVIGSSREWWLLSKNDVEIEPLDSLDLTRRVAAVKVEAVRLRSDRRVDVDDSRVDAVGALLFAAEAAGIAGWCMETAVEHALVREQFGYPIGHFQAVKHGCADMLVLAEQARAAAWDAAVAADASVSASEALVAAETAAAIAPQAAFDNAKRCIQILGGIGFTWEHDAHLYLRRAQSVRALLGGASTWRLRLARHAKDGVRRQYSLALPEEAEPLRREVRSAVERLAKLSPRELRRELGLGGWLMPHLPPPAGRSAGALEQVLISEELKSAGIERPHLEVGAWALPTLLEHGTEQQRKQWVEPTLLGELKWCQLFSEPGAGSDLAALSTTARPVDGGFVVTGQKVWTSMAADADLGILLARTDPDQPRHRGISYFVLDMHAPGVDVRPLRELTGDAMFNEVFLTDVFVPEDHLIGELHGGWTVTRSTLAHERLSISEGTSFGGGLDDLLRRTAALPADDLVDERLGAVLAEAQTVVLLGLRNTTRALSGTMGAEAAVRKLLGAENEQRVLELGMDLLGSDATHQTGDDAKTWVSGFLGGRCLTIAGGTSEVQRNVIAEQLLGLPRDVGYK